MSLIAAFLWNKSPYCSISTLIFDSDNVRILSAPKRQIFKKSYLDFRRDTKKVIKEFFYQIEHWHKIYKQPVVVEFKIVFHAYDIPYLFPAKESKFVYQIFSKFFKETKKKIKSMSIKPQLRRRLSGKPLKHFKAGLRSMYLVSRKKDTGFEYHLWAVALHATPTTYAIQLKQVRTKLVNAMWNEILE